MDSIVIVAGPTAAGKTAVAMALQDLLGGPRTARLISMDSALVYRGMDIGTAKPTPTELRAYPHDLIDIVDPATAFSVADFVGAADAAVRAAWDAGQLPVLVGGTMLYAKRFIEGIAALPPADAAVRAELDAAWERDGPHALHEQLRASDPDAAAAIHPHNRQRLLRALEVVRLSGQALSQLWQTQQGEHAQARLGAGRIDLFGLMPDDRTRLHALIETRFATMLAAGFVAEVEALRERGDLHLDIPAMRAVGYRQIWLHLDGELSLAQAQADALTATRRLAKRQITWMRGFLDMEPLAWGSPEKVAQQILQSVSL
ncbi:MAG: tRNA (adenosine(37)-N6)-dimethylallyltransferase MiaA [Pseudomonadota bacterium]